ncbi:MAG: aminopeptidase N, partial [Sphingomonadales bacterium]
MPTETPNTIYLKDYTPPAWLVDTVDLHVAIHQGHAEVRARLACRRNPQGAGGALVLNGAGLALQAIALDGAALDPARYTQAEDTLTIATPLRDAFTLETVVRIEPDKNTRLSGLYRSRDGYFTQCEAEGFRRITFFPDRPDVMARYTCTIEAERERFPQLLSNGNLAASGISEHDAARHWARWEDPFPKPSYLFALVAAKLDVLEDSFVTRSGRTVHLAIYVEPGKLDQCGHAMAALKKAMRWDEERFGLEMDLDRYMIVAVGDFNMGAMENKGLNLFNTKYVLARPDTATDADYQGIDRVVAHEYFHNWTGNRVTCRDWFQLSLKEGLTVFRDQEFGADTHSRAVTRIQDVRVLRSAQFPEDSGPLAHPIRPDSYQEISNFYTSTVYNKGAEVIRMMRTLAGPERFRRGTDLYFSRHDGEAATCEDFVKAIEEGAGLDLAQFRLWYSQAGTPKVDARLFHDGDTATLTLKQSVPPTPGQPAKEPMAIPLRIALFDRTSGKHHGEQIVTINQPQVELKFPGFASRPALSLNRGFSAPVAIETDSNIEDLVFLAANDDDPFARYEAMQQLVVQHLVAEIGGGLDSATREEGRAAILRALAPVITAEPGRHDGLDDLMRGELMILPSEAYLAEQLPISDPGAMHAAREGLKAWLGHALERELVALHERACAVPYSLDAAARGSRKLKTQALVYLAA